MVKKNDMLGMQVSALGLGCMRLPMKENAIDEERTAEMVRYAMEHGVNYFDTAYPYINGMSEIVMGRLLREYPRESYYLATKYPGHQISDTYDPAAVFEEQLQKCGVDYFDLYLLHNVYEKSIEVYLDPQWGIIDYFVEQKKKGRIRYLGFSTHGSARNIEEFLKIRGDDMDFCQIQLNYLDWTLQDAKAKYELLEKWNKPIVVMEPVRGGRLAKLADEEEAQLKALRPDESIPAWSFRWLQMLPNVKVTLSGMSNMEQMTDNVKTFSDERPLNEQELETLYRVADGMMNAIPCTACRYCCDGCPMELDIPLMLQIYNDLRFSPHFTASMRIEALPEEKWPSACIACGKCTQICPQNIDIPTHLQGLCAELAKQPRWEDLCRERAEAAAKLRAQSAGK